MSTENEVIVAAPVRLDNGKRAIALEGKPFLTLGAQFRTDRWLLKGGFTYAGLSEAGVIGWAKALHCNTIQLTIWWKEIEPERNRFDWTLLEWSLNECRKYGLKMEIIWFGSNVCGAGWESMTPRWIAENPRQYSRIATKDGKPLGEGFVHGIDGKKYTLCVENPDLLETERNTIRHMMNYLLTYDVAHTVIGFQVENEPSLVQHYPIRNEIDRCYCHRCSQLYDEGGYSDPREFTKTSLTRYLDRIASEVKRSPRKIYTRVNWIQPYWEFDEDTDKVLRDAPHIDFVGYDTYERSQSFIYSILTGDQAMEKGNIPHLGELEGGLHGCAEKIVDVFAANGYGVSVYQLAGFTEGDDNYLLAPDGSDARAWTDEVRQTYRLLGKASALLALKRHGFGDDIQFFNCMGRTDRHFSGAKKTGGYSVAYSTERGGIGIAIAETDGLVLIATKSGVFEIDGLLADCRCESGAFGEGGDWRKEEELNDRLKRKERVCLVSIGDYEVMKMFPHPPA